MAKDIEYFRKKIEAMDYTPLTDEELAIVKERDKKAVANARIDGAHATPEENEFFAMLHEMRVPVELCESIVKEWALAGATEDTLIKQDVDIEKIRHLQKGTKDKLVFGSQWVINQAGDTYFSLVSASRDYNDQGDLYVFYSKGQSAVFHIDIKDIDGSNYIYSITSKLSESDNQFVKKNKSKIERFFSYFKNFNHNNNRFKNINAKIIN